MKDAAQKKKPTDREQDASEDSDQSPSEGTVQSYLQNKQDPIHMHDDSILTPHVFLSWRASRPSFLSCKRFLNSRRSRAVIAGCC